MIRPLISTLILTTVLLPADAFGAARYIFDKSRPPLLSKFGGKIYDIPDAQLQQIVGTATYPSHTSSPIPGTPNLLNTDRTIVLTHRFYWILSGTPVRYATDTDYKIKETTGYTKTSKEETEKNLGVDASAKVFGIGLKIKASLKLTQTETEEWREETTTEIDKKYKAQYIYCRWSLIDELASHVTTKSSVDATDKPASGSPVITDALFRNTAIIYEDGAPDITAKLLAEAVKSFGSSAMRNVVLTAPMQLQ